jgi:hypothetical protein
MSIRFRSMIPVALAAVAVLGCALAAQAQSAAPALAPAALHDHVHVSGSGLPHGLPRICADAGIRSKRSGAWSSPSTWSGGKVPAAGDAVLVGAGNVVVYAQVSDAALSCVDVEGTLRFDPHRNTRLEVGTLTVLQSGTLEIGTQAAPIRADVTAELVIADQPLDLARDPEQLGTGLLGLGRITMFGAAKSPTFTRLASEPLEGDRSLVLGDDVQGWKVGDKLVLPDTRQLLAEESRGNYVPQWESPRIAAIAGRRIELAAPLAFDHKGAALAQTPAADAKSTQQPAALLPHVGNVSRNVIVRSANPQGTRGHVIFVGRPDIDVRYTLFAALGRTQLGVLDNVEYDGDGRAVHVGSNQIGRYSLHFHHVAGPLVPQKNGYQFTVIGNAIDDASKWGITVHASHYGLVRDNVVYDSKGAGIVTEDGSESFNLFAHNFAIRSQGSGEFAPRSGYSGGGSDPGGEGAGFWFRGPNNYIRDNVAANVEVFGYGLAAGELGEIHIPKQQGADVSEPDGYVVRDTTAMPVLEFTGNEAYGAIQNGVAVGWNATLADSRIWHTSISAVTAVPTDWLTVDGITARGDPRSLAHEFESPAGIWLGDYAAKTIVVRNADVQGMRVGVESPFFMNVRPEPGRGKGEVLIENSFLRDYVGVAVGTSYVEQGKGAGPLKHATVADTRFEPLPAPRIARAAPAAISMNYGTSSGDDKPRVPIAVRGYDAKPNDDFRIFYSNEVTPAKAPCANARPQIEGFACAGPVN